MAVKYEIDLNETGKEFPHYWELCVEAATQPRFFGGGRPQSDPKSP